ncbi:MAG TPA: lysophospholipid acyltransferase family protein [Chitinivibrionales bacterium]
MNASNQWDGKSKGSATGTRIFIKLISLTGLFPAYCLLVPVSLYYTCKEKKSSAALRRFRSHLSLPTTFFHLWRHFFSFGMNLLDRYAFLNNPGTTFKLHIIGESIIKNAVASGKGALLVGAHMGNWEIAGNLLNRRLGFIVNFAMVDAEKNDMRAALAPVFARRRASIIPVNQQPLEFLLSVVTALRRNEIVCLHADRMAGGRGKQALFFKKPATFPLSPFALAATSGAPIIPFFAVKKGLRSYEIRCFEPIDVNSCPGADSDERYGAALKKYLAILERMVTENPYEWFNFYDFWGEGAKPSA